MHDDKGHAPIFDAINNLRERVATLEANRKSDTETDARLERRIARIEMGIIAIGIGTAIVVWKMIAAAAGIPT